MPVITTSCNVDLFTRLTGIIDSRVKHAMSHELHCQMMQCTRAARSKLADAISKGVLLDETPLEGVMKIVYEQVKQKIDEISFGEPGQFGEAIRNIESEIFELVESNGSLFKVLHEVRDLLLVFFGPLCDTCEESK